MNRIARTMLAVAVAGLTADLAAQSDTALDHANPNSAFLRCGTRHPSPEEARMIEDQIVALRTLVNGKGKPGGGGAAAPCRRPGSIPVDVYFHVITDGNSGAVSAARINAQIAVLNDAYSGGTGGFATPYTFSLVATTEPTTPTWYTELLRARPRRR